MYSCMEIKANWVASVKKVGVWIFPRMLAQGPYENLFSAKSSRWAEISALSGSSILYIQLLQTTDRSHRIIILSQERIIKRECLP